MRKAILLFATLVAFGASFTTVNTPASAQGIYQGGSYEPGLVPWRGRTSLGPWGVQRHYGGRQSYGGPVYYRSSGYNMRYGYRSRGYAYSSAASVPRIVRYGGTCYRAGVSCPCPPRRYAKRYYSPRVYRPAPVVRTARSACCGGGATTITTNPTFEQKVQVGNIGEGATVTINTTGAQNVGGGTPGLRTGTSTGAPGITSATVTAGWSAPGPDGTCRYQYAPGQFIPGYVAGNGKCYPNGVAAP